MYSFLNYIQTNESERLCARSIKLKENPLAGLMSQAHGQKSRPVNKKGQVDSSDDEEEKVEQLPIGFDYTENFPALPDFDGKGRKLREADERRKKL